MPWYPCVQDDYIAVGHRPSVHTHISSSVPELLYNTQEGSSLTRRPPASVFDRARSNRELCTASQNEKLRSVHLARKESITNLVSVRALLPQYRPAPDYETAVQQKYQQVAALGEGGYQQLLYSSQPEIPSSNLQEVVRIHQ